MKRSLYLLLIQILFSTAVFAQISAPTADGTDVTNYPVFSETDDIFVFCTADSLAETATLTVSTELSGTKTFLWEKYDEGSASFEFYYQESSAGQSSQINNLADGCYRATVTLGGTTEIDRAWVFNNWIFAEASITDSNCESFKLSGSFTSADLNYYDLSNNAQLEVYKDVKAEWQVDGASLSSLINLQIYSPPAEDKIYTLRIYDILGCEGTADIIYESMVTEASFTADPASGEAPLTVTFSNTSENGTSGYYEWYFYRDISEIKEEAESTTEEIDSIMLVAYDDSPTYTYENTGNYLVKLISKKVTDYSVCADTFTIEDYIEVDSSYVLAPNVFTPNGDGVNDEFVVKFWSMESVEISVFNRWGKRVHFWQSGDVQGFEESRTESVWDGRIGGRYASPGVYYWNVEGRGRDGEKRHEHGFVHVFRGKD